MRLTRSSGLRTAIAVLAISSVGSILPSCDLLRPRFGLEELAGTQLTTESAPWYVLHDILANGAGVSLSDAKTGALVDAVDYLTTQRQLTDRTGRLIESIYEEDGLPHFPRTDGQFIVQGHPGQFLAVLIGAGVPLSHPILLDDGRRHTLADAVENVKLELRPQRILVDPPEKEFADHELGWSIALIANAVGTEAVWKNEWGEDVSIEDLIEIAIQRPAGWGSCAGTHELFGLARAMRVHRSTHSEFRGVWARLEEYLEDAKALARASQHADGSFDYNWARPEPGQRQSGLSPSKKVHTTGHMLEWLVLASTAQEIDAPHLSNAYRFLESRRFAEVSLVPGRRGTDLVSYGSLTHAVSGMTLYREALAARGTKDDTARSY